MSNSETGAHQTNGPEAGSDASGEESGILSAEQREALALSLWDAGLVRPESLARAVVNHLADNEGVMCTEDLAAIVREHRAEALAEVERRIDQSGVRTDSAQRWGINTALNIVRDYRQEISND